MDKVNSAIKSLECVDILQVNVKEGTEVVPLEHGSGTGFVKNEEIEEMDASNAADEPIQDVMNNCSAESEKEEDREPPVHTTNTVYEKNGKSSAAISDASTTLPRKTNHIDDKLEDKEKRTIKTETGASTASLVAASRSQSANEGVMPRRSKRRDKSMPDQAMTSQEKSAAARSKEMDSSTTGGGARKRKSENVSVLESNKKCTRARMNTVHVPRSDRSVSKKRCALIFEERCVQLLAFKDELGTAMFLVSLQVIHHWETFVAT
jgi:hypothetical protein